MSWGSCAAAWAGWWRGSTPAAACCTSRNWTPERTQGSSPYLLWQKMIMTTKLQNTRRYAKPIWILFVDNSLSGWRKIKFVNIKFSQIIISLNRRTVSSITYRHLLANQFDQCFCYICCRKLSMLPHATLCKNSSVTVHFLEYQLFYHLTTVHLETKGLNQLFFFFTFI